MIRDYEPSLPRGGRAALEEYFKERFSVTGFRFAFTSRTSNWLETWHSSGWRIAPSFGQPEKPSRSKMPGRGLHVYERQPDGLWKLALDIWNSDRPVALQPSGAPGSG